MTEKPDTAGLACSSLSAARYRVTFTAGERLDLPEYLGSTLRGAFGRAFRTLACPARFDESCPIPSQCPYHLIFESSPPPGSQALRTHEEIPRPFVIAPEWITSETLSHELPDSLPQTGARSSAGLGVATATNSRFEPGSAARGKDRRASDRTPETPVVRRGAEGQRARRIYEPGEELSFGLTLIGRAQEFFPHFVVALREMDRLGRSRQAITLSRIEAGRPLARFFAGEGLGEGADWCEPLGGGDGDNERRPQVVYDARDNIVRGMASPLTLAECAQVLCPEGALTLEFITQTRLKHDGRWAPVPEFHILFRRLLGRLSSMARFHCGAPLEVDFKALIDAAFGVRLVSNNTRWMSWSRYSSRQNTKMQWEGLLGRAVYEGDLAPFWPYLVFGQYVHVGHGATFGLGRFRIMLGDSAGGQAKRKL